MSIREELQALLDAYAKAYEADDALACAKMYTTEGELHSPYAPPARGRLQIEELHRTWTQDVGEEKKLTIVYAGSSGDLAWCLATYSEGHATGNGTSLNIFERQPDGSWLARISSLNSADPPVGS